MNIMFESETMPPSQTLKAAMIILTKVPILLVYPFTKIFCKRPPNWGEGGKVDFLWLGLTFRW